MAIFRNLVFRLNRALGIIAVVIIVLMLVATIADVGRRALTGRPLAGVIETSEVAMIAIVYLSLAFAESKGAHVSVTLLLDRLSNRRAAIVNSVGIALVIMMVTWMVYVTGERALVSIQHGEYRFGLVKIPVWPARLLIPIGLASYLLALTVRLLDTIMTRKASSAIVNDQAPQPLSGQGPV